MEIIKLKLSVTMCFLLPIGNKYLLIDTGYERDKDMFFQKLQSLNISINDIAYLLLTHHHDDHAGLLNEVKTRNQDCRIIMHSKAPALLEKGKNDMTRGGIINSRANMIMKISKKLNKDWDYSFPPYKVDNNDIIINGDTALKNIGIEIPGKIIYTPGHSDDSISLLLDNGNCFVGDAAANMLQFTGAKYCVIFITDLQQYYQSWEKIIKENAQMIYPAHGKPFKIDKLKNNLYKNKKEKVISLEL
ncbi:MAG: MBL fold metallo-hydrolase [Marinifilaceae bacterium]|jgi:glyoxylase-like metal-dependent hydrolase (beta-lactamase superfamily II)|nr:MBL fold metallo-hydrolase [Marinifilaceae bacterium]